VRCEEGVQLLAGEGSGKGAIASPYIFFIFVLKMEHSDAVFRLDLTEETRT